MVLEVRVLMLNASQNGEATLYRLEKDWVLRFVLGPSLHAHTVRLFTNHPIRKEKFVRTAYHEVHWQSASSTKSDRHDVHADLRISMAGNFQYYFTIDRSPEKANANGEGCFMVDPTLQIGPAGSETEITMDCLQCQTVLTKNLGSFEGWKDKLYPAKAVGYNMIHFTPIQELGISNSAYSLKNQNRINPAFSTNGKKYDFSDIEAFIKMMKEDWQVLSLTDLVYNHTAKNSDWIFDHPECVYNLANSPHLRPAYVIDRILWHFNEQIADEKYVKKGIPADIENEIHLSTIRKLLLTEVFPEYNVYEFFTCDVDQIVKDFKNATEENRQVFHIKGDLQLIQDPGYRRLKTSIDMDVALKQYNTDSDALNENRPNVMNRQQRLELCCEDLKCKLEALNEVKKLEIDEHVKVAVHNFLANARYRFLEPGGPKLGTVTREDPIMTEYFSIPAGHAGSLQKEEDMMNREGQFIFATNGWVMSDNPLRNFAEPDSNVYLRRELVNWGDSVKLRYGDKPEDCPYLWQHMKEYTETTARMFPGVRLDNCHSTPMHVAEYMMDVARQVRPDLYVVAELFTGSEYLDNLFLNKLGINSLIREALQAGHSPELGRLVFKYGGLPVGAFVQPHVRPLVPTVAHAMFFDQTHDNKCPIKERSVYDILPTAALVSMACCASGSNRGYDELVPQQIDVVSEKRLYSDWSPHGLVDAHHISANTGIVAGKRLLNQLHFTLGYQGYSQVFVDQVDGNVVSVTRHNPNTHESVVLIARTAFQKPGDINDTGLIRPVCIPGGITEVIFEAKLVPYGDNEYNKDKDIINGLPDYRLEIRENLAPSDTKFVQIVPNSDGYNTQVMLVNFTPSSVIAFRVSLPQVAKTAILNFRKGMNQFGFLMRTYSGRSLVDNKNTDFRGIVGRLTLDNLNKILYRTDAEERADGNGFGAYDVPNSGPMVYCGLQGIISLLCNIRPSNDLGHPLCGNLRDGDWLPSYLAARLKVHEGTKEFAVWFERIFMDLSEIPRYLIPCYFDAVITGAYMILRDQVYTIMSDFVDEGSTFIHALAMGSVQMCGLVRDARLPPLSPNLPPPQPTTVTNEKTGKSEQLALSLSAGFPHFASDFMRNWGRDTFIALRGLLLLTRRYQDARYLILAYAGCLRHGLIPNLLSGGTHSRFNCRDAVWFWLYCIQEYCKIVPNGIDILKDPVSRIFPNDSSEPQKPGQCGQPLYDVMQEALQCHAQGMKYRERNAGRKIDEQMSDEGFNVEIGVRWDTGFVYGGNEHNCGTWMDKMGSSEKAGIKGKPATPRDGSAVELIGLCKSTVSWLSKISKEKMYPYDGVYRIVDDKKTKVTFDEWNHLISANFEKLFWINTTPVPENEPHPELITRRGFYMDSHLATQFWANFQLRPNFPIAMVVAPELFSPDHAWTALNVAQDVLLGPLGMKTLDPKDWSYVGDYINSDDSGDAHKANGFNYHNGPEWVWPIGYFLRAKLYFAHILSEKDPDVLRQTIDFVKTVLTKHYEQIMRPPWWSLPELTNSNGSYCNDSCQAQAWSVGCVLEVLHDLEQFEHNHH